MIKQFWLFAILVPATAFLLASLTAGSGKAAENMGVAESFFTHPPDEVTISRTYDENY